MRMSVEKTTDNDIPCMEVNLFLGDENLLATETFAGINAIYDKYNLQKYVLETLHRSRIVLGSELDNLARTFHSTASVMYFRLIPESNVKGGIYRQQALKNPVNLRYWLKIRNHIK